MQLGSAFAIYFVIWWTTLFAVLPFGARAQGKGGETVAGADPGAPSVTRGWWLIGVNTGVASVVFVLFYLFVLPQL